MTLVPSKTTYAASAPRQATFVAYINGIEVPAKSASMRYGVWQMPEMQLEMVADPVLIRLGNQDRVQVAVFYYDDCDVDPSVVPTFRLYGEGEITGWGYRNTSGGRSIVFTVVNQIAIFTQLFVQFMTNIDDMIGHATQPGNVADYAIGTSSLVYPFVLFNNGLLPGKGQANSTITRPFDFLYNAVKGMMAAVVPSDKRTVPAANFFTRWARLTNFHNRFAATPYFDNETNPGVFPVLSAVQKVSAINVIEQKLLSQVQNTGSIWDMLQLVYTTMIMEVAMIPSMPLVTVDLATGLVQPTPFGGQVLYQQGVTASSSKATGNWVPILSAASRALSPKRLQNYFAKPQMLFSIPPSCNVMFPSQIVNIAYDENYVTQPTRIYFNDEVLPTMVKTDRTGTDQAVSNALARAWPLQADAFAKQRDTQHPSFNGKNFLLYPEEFFKGPVLDRRKAPPWLFFLKQSENGAGTITGAAPNTGKVTSQPADSSTATPAPPAQPQPTPPSASNVPPMTMLCSTAFVGTLNANNTYTFVPAVEALKKQTYFTSAVAAAGVPVDVACAWVQEESGGINGPAETSYLNERGFFQIMGQHGAVGGSAALSQASSEAGQLGLTVDQSGTAGSLFQHGREVPNSDQDPTAELTVNATFSVQAGLKLVKKYRALATQVANQQRLSWPEGDLWRLTKAAHVGMGFWTGTSYFPGFFALARNTLGRNPVNWAEMYNAISGSLPTGRNYIGYLNNATACGGLAPGSSGSMITKGNTRAFSASGAVPPPTAPTPTTTTSTPPVAAASQAPATPAPGSAAATTVENDALDVYQLYAKYEYFRERYARRNGSANIVWNPYVVPGFPGVLFDQRASRVDLIVYITTVQHMMSNDGKRSTGLSFIYGRQFQEMFQLMADEFALNDATARGSAPEEPIRDTSKVVQSFIQAETFYQQLFYGAQPLFGKSASFDFRAIVGIQSPVPNGSPTLIYVDGPDVVTQDATVAASMTLTNLIPQRDTISATVMSLQANVAGVQASIAALNPTSQPDQNSAYATIQLAEYNAMIGQLAIYQSQLASAQAQLASFNQQISAANAIVQGTSTTAASAVTHNLLDAAAGTLVPLPASQQYFDSRDAALRYNWRPICSLDEYVVFLNSAGQGSIPAFGHPRSVGARYFDRIQTYSSPPAGFAPPPGADGLTPGVPVPGLSTSFPQTSYDWDAALLAYKNNVLNNPAPRT
jgi:hypothetical protein